MPISINAFHYISYLAKRIERHRNEVHKMYLLKYLGAAERAFITGNYNTMVRYCAHISANLRHS